MRNRVQGAGIRVAEVQLEDRNPDQMKTPPDFEGRSVFLTPELVFGGLSRCCR
jgi:hypothetical protein